MNTVVLAIEMDDLTVLKGIKKTRQAWLREQLNVVTYADLAALSADAIEAKLRADHRFVARELIELWLETAASLTTQSAPSTAPASPEKDRWQEWQPFASFVVEFQERRLAGQPKEQRTKVHYMESDVERAWDGLAHAALAGWIKQQVGEVPPPPAPEPVAERPSPSTQPIDLTLARLLVWQPPQAAQPQLIYEPERPLTGFLQADVPFSLTADLVLAQRPEEAVAVVLTAELHARNLSTGRNTRLVLQMGGVEEGGQEGTAMLDQVTLPAGFYRFGLLFRQANLRGIQFLELPRLQVV